MLREFKDEKMAFPLPVWGHSYGTESLGRDLSLASEAALWGGGARPGRKGCLAAPVAEGMAFDPRTSSRLLDQSDAGAADARLIRDIIFRPDAEPEPEMCESEKKKTA